MRQKAQRGFTLLEVLISILILATAGVSLMALISGNVRAAADAQNRFLASLVADNTLEMAMADPRLPKNEVTSGVTNLGNEDWKWVMRREETPVDGFYRLSVSVSRKGFDQTLVTIVAFRTGKRR